MTSEEPGRPSISTLPLNKLADTGLLWLINTQVFWPRGYSLMIDTKTKKWTLLGDGSEPWMTDEDTAKGRFFAVEQTLDTFRRMNTHG